VNRYHYTIILEPDREAGGFVVTVPALPGCMTQGDNYEEAIANAKEAIKGWIESAKKHGEEIPTEEAPLQMASVDVDVAA
jgi:antitoxin HicB